MRAALLLLQGPGTAARAAGIAVPPAEHGWDAVLYRANDLVAPGPHQPEPMPELGAT
jgi:hypothetical protein